MSMCRVISSVVEEGILLWLVGSLGKTLVNLCPASFLYSKAKNLPVTYTRYLLTSYFCIPVPYGGKDLFFWWFLSFYKVLQVFIEPFNFSFFGISGWDIYLDYCDVEWFALEMNQDHSVIFEITLKYCISDCFVDYEGYSITSKNFLPTVVHIMVIGIKFTHSYPF